MTRLVLWLLYMCYQITIEPLYLFVTFFSSLYCYYCIAIRFLVLLRGTASLFFQDVVDPENAVSVSAAALQQMKC